MNPVSSQTTAATMADLIPAQSCPLSRISYELTSWQRRSFSEFQASPVEDISDGTISVHLRIHGLPYERMN